MNLLLHPGAPFPPPRNNGHHAASPPPVRSFRERASRWVARRGRVLLGLAVMGAVLLAQGFHFHRLSETRRTARAEIERTLRTGEPRVAALLEAFDRSTQDLLFATTGPYFLLSVTVLFLAGQFLDVRRRLAASERSVRVLRDPERPRALELFADNLAKSFYGFEPDFFQQNVARIVDDVTSQIQASLEIWPTPVKICYFHKDKRLLPQTRVRNKPFKYGVR